MTIFRGEMGGWFLIMFISLLVGKVWGWISESRVEFLEQQPPSNPRLFHARLATSIVLHVLFNSSMLKYCVQTVLERARPDMMVMFGFEFAVLTILSCSTAARYTISLVEIYITRQQLKSRIEERRSEIRGERARVLQEHVNSSRSGFPTDLPDENDINEMELDIPGWEEKGRWIFYLDLLTDFLKLFVYLAFFAILTAFYGLPIHILRDVVVTIRSFGKRIVDFLRYRNATRDMNERYPDATAQDVGSEDVCIICREQMTPLELPAGANGAAPTRTRVPERLRPKKLPCGHVLHFSCLRSWLERQQNCPTCRRPVVMPPRNRLFPGQGANDVRAAGNARNPLAPDAFPRARFYQFGPFRIGFGAGRADMFQNLQQQIHQGNMPVQQPGNINPPGGAQHIGFGFGIGRRPPANPTAPVAPAAPPVIQPSPVGAPNIPSVQNQIHQIEQQISQDINNLRVAVEQLHLVRHLQAELQRLGSLQANPTQPNAGPGVFHQGPAAPPFSPTSTRRQFMSDPRTPALGAGDTRLPEGVSLPEGWTLLPLHSTESGTGEATSSNPAAATPAPETSTATPTPSFQPPPETSTNQVESAHVENVHESRNRDENSANSQSLPNWFTLGETTGQSNNGQTDLAAHERPSEKPSGQPAASNPESGPSEQPQEDSTEEGDSSASAAKGKGRVATVEEVADAET